MNTLMIESAEIDGALKVLLKLQNDFNFSIVPSVKCYAKSTAPLSSPSYEYFPLDKKYRKLAGEAMVRFLLDKKNMRKWLYEDCILYATYERDNKGKVVRINIKAGDGEKGEG